MSNAFKKRAEEEVSQYHGRTCAEFCWTTNLKARDMGWDKWYYCKDIDGVQTVLTKEGDEARNIWRMMQGWRPEYVGWDDEKLLSEYRILRSVARNGMPEDEFNKTAMGNKNDIR